MIRLTSVALLALLTVAPAQAFTVVNQSFTTTQQFLDLDGDGTADALFSIFQGASSGFFNATIRVFDSDDSSRDVEFDIFADLHLTPLQYVPAFPGAPPIPVSPVNALFTDGWIHFGITTNPAFPQVTLTLFSFGPNPLPAELVPEPSLTVFAVGGLIALGWIWTRRRGRLGSACRSWRFSVKNGRR